MKLERKMLKTILIGFIKYVGSAVGLSVVGGLIVASFVYGRYYDPTLNSELYKFKTNTGNYYTGYIKNTSKWKHSDKLIFRSTFENGKIETFDVKPSFDVVNNKSIEESKEAASFSMDRLTTQEWVTIDILVNTSSVVKENIRLGWGNGSKKEIIPKCPSEMEQQIFKAGISLKERANALESDVGKMR